MATQLAEIQKVNSGPMESRTIEQVLLNGDLKGLSEGQRLSYYDNVCRSLGLNPLTRPFEYIVLNGKLTFYARRDCAEQLRKIHGVSVTELTTQTIEGVYVVTAKAADKSGRTDAGTGAVNIAGLKGDALANAIMKAETKAKRRVTLSLCGLGFLDETEIETIPGAAHAPVNLKQVITGKLLQCKEAENCTIAAIGETLRKCTKVVVVDGAHDSLLVQLGEYEDKREVEVEAIEKTATSGKKYLELVAILKINGKPYLEGALRESIVAVEAKKLAAKPDPTEIQDEDISLEEAFERDRQKKLEVPF